MDFKESQRELNNIYNKALELYKSLNMDALKVELKKLEEQTFNEAFWKDKENSADVNAQISRLRKRIDPWDKMLAGISEDKDLFDMAFAENDENLLKDLSDKVDKYISDFEKLETVELFSGEDDMSNAFLMLHPGAGGTESQDWAVMLYRMYVRWAEDKGFNVQLIDFTPGEEAGIKSCTVLISGDYAYGMLRAERGIHRLVRISPFDSNSRRHTSFASIEVMPEVSDEIEIDINENDLRIDTYRASGAGGQHVNKTDSAVRITHIPTNTVVQCQNERSQHKNKAFAMKVLKSKLYELEKDKMEKEKLEKMGQKKDISWGNQIRSYVFHPYNLVKDHRTDVETGNTEGVMNGDIDKFIYAYLRMTKGAK